MATVTDEHQFKGIVHQGKTTANSIHNNNASSHPMLCSGCARPIVDQYLLKALDCFWHEDCLKCGCCDCRLGEVGSTLYTKANLILCKRDYLRMFGTSGSCAACCKAIPAFEMVMRAKSNVYHLDCFACQQCHQRFCVGERFYLSDNKILCESDYEERLIMTTMLSSNPPAVQQHIQRRVSDIHQHPTGGGIAYNQPFQQQFDQDNAAQYASYNGQQFATHRQLYQLAGQQHKHGSPSDGSSSGYGSPDSVLMEER